VPVFVTLRGSLSSTSRSASSFAFIAAISAENSIRVMTLSGDSLGQCHCPGAHRQKVRHSVLERIDRLEARGDHATAIFLAANVGCPGLGANQSHTGWQNIGMNSCHWTASIIRRTSTSPARIEE